MTDKKEGLRYSVVKNHLNHLLAGDVLNQHQLKAINGRIKRDTVNKVMGKVKSRKYNEAA